VTGQRYLPNTLEAVVGYLQLAVVMIIQGNFTDLSVIDNGKM